MTASAVRADPPTEQTAPPGRRGDGRAGPAGLTVTLVSLAALLVVSATAGLAIGSVHVPPGQVWGIVTHALGASWAEPDWSGARETIVLDVRAPRVLLGAVAGAGLAVVGTALQALIRNPLAEPYLLGVSSGASLGAVVVIVFGVTLLGPVSLPVAAFAGALGALLLVYATARTGGGSRRGGWSSPVWPSPRSSPPCWTCCCSPPTGATRPVRSSPGPSAASAA